MKKEKKKTRENLEKEGKKKKYRRGDFFPCYSVSSCNNTNNDKSNVGMH